MNGISHATIGAGAGFATAYSLGAELYTTVILTGTGLIAGLAPDLDTGGKLANKISLSDSMLKVVATMIGLLMVVYSCLEGNGSDRWLGSATGILIVFLAQKLSRKIMLMITGVGVLVGGLFLSTLWLILIGVYIVGAALLPHRSYTHSLIGLIFFAYITFLIAQDFQIDGFFIASIAGYASHLVADLRLLPMNKKGVKLLLPFSKAQF